METNRCPACFGWGERDILDGEELASGPCFPCDGTGFVPVHVERAPATRIASTRRIKDNPIIKMVLAAFDGGETNEK